MSKLIFSVAVTAFLLLTFGCSISSHTTPAARPQNNANDKYQVKIDNFSFTPQILTVPAGTKVTWINKDDVPHTVVSTNNAFTHSPALDTDESFSYSFTKPGVYEYYCSVHPKMVGKVVVQ